MEEFAESQPVTDEERRLAEARKLTLIPLHADVQAEESPVIEALASERATQSTLNVESDSEDTAKPEQLLHPATAALAHKTILHKSPPRHVLTIVVVLAIVAALLGGAMYWLIYLTHR